MRSPATGKRAHSLLWYLQIKKTKPFGSAGFLFFLIYNKRPDRGFGA
jgi:hypothetical protein